MLVNPQNRGKAFEMDKDSVLYDIMYDDVVRWLDINIKRLLRDYMSIKHNANIYSIDGLWDYSYLITPAFKALEGALLKVGEELGFDIKKYKHRVGLIFNDENLEKYYDKVLEKIEALSVEQKMDIKQWLDNARRILKSLRHTPAHFEGEVKNNLTKSFLSGDLILSTINEMCHTLIQNRLFPSILKEEERKRREERARIISIKGTRCECT